MRDPNNDGDTWSIVAGAGTSGGGANGGAGETSAAKPIIGAWDVARATLR